MKQRSKTFSAAFVLFSSLSVNGFHAMAKGNDVKSVWQAAPIKADGDNSDWPQPYPWYNEKSGMAYAISNDKDNLYITFKANDAAAKKSFLSGGVIVCIDTNGNKSQNITISFAPAGMHHDDARFQGQGRPDDMPQSPGGNDVPPPDDNVQGILPEDGGNSVKLPPVKMDFMLQGFANGEGRFPMGRPNPSGVVAAAGYDEYKALVWEAVIPFKSFFKNSLTAADAERRMSVGFIFTGMHAHMLGERPQIPDDDVPKSEGGSGNSGGGHGGGRHGGGMKINNMPGGDMGEADMPPTVNPGMPGAGMPEKTFRTWQKIALAWRE
ncbi:hypothetical protein ACTHGU_05530 [Chitinophagaceae bacterium MMS25-I14]